MSSFLSRLHADLRRARITRRNASLNRDDIPVGTHKRYTRMTRIALPEPQASDATLAAALKARTSTSDLRVMAHSWDMFGSLLGLAARSHRDSFKRPYPSESSLYPIEIYIISTALDRNPPSVMHYAPDGHALEILWPLPNTVAIGDLFRNEADTPATGLIILTSVWRRSSDKYGDFSYILALLEAGHVSQNLLLTLTALAIPSCPLSGFNDERISHLLDLNPDEEQVIHAIAF